MQQTMTYTPQVLMFAAVLGGVVVKNTRAAEVPVGTQLATQQRTELATFLPTSSEVSDLNRYRSGEIDITNGAIPPNLYAKMKRKIPEPLHINSYLCTFYYEINTQRAPFTDARVSTVVELTLARDNLPAPAGAGNARKGNAVFSTAPARNITRLTGNADPSLGL